MSELVLGALIGGGGTLLSVIISLFFTHKNTLADALDKAARALNITSDELVQSLVEVQNLKHEVRDKDATIILLTGKYMSLKTITRKLYERMEKANIDPGLTQDEKALLLDTQERIKVEKK